MTDPTPGDVRKLLNTHGYAFQYAVIRRVRETPRSPWIFEAAEFAVAAVHIDFVLRSHPQPGITYLVAECKRADPNRANWCFVSAPYTRREPRYDNEIVFQQVAPIPGANLVRAKPVTRVGAVAGTGAWGNPCHLHFELRTPAPGDGIGRSRSAIDEAATQVLRGMNGLIDHLFPGGTPHDAHTRAGATFLPVIFTTARLWVATGDLSEADLRTGLLLDGWGALTPVPWLWFNYNQSPALRHQLVRPATAGLSEALHSELTRTIAVVAYEGIDAFLRADLPSLVA